MACIALTLNADGAPASDASVRALMDVEPYRQSRQTCVAVDGSVALGFVPLRVCVDDTKTQPRRRGIRVSAVMDGRFDGRADLVDSLVTGGVREDLTVADDVELLLHAYGLWGADCVTRLLGDFAFCLWDGDHQRLLCARDHFGVKPLYYAHHGSRLLVSSTLDGLKRHPAVESVLRDEAIGDFLLFGVCVEASQTAFAGISRVPPAHRLQWSPDRGLQVDRYWALQAGEIERFADARDYVDRFSALLRVAVEDRVRSDRVSVLMSGGLDSTSITTVAAERLGSAAPDRLRVLTIVYESLMRDEERHYSSLVAGRLGIPISHVAADHYRPFERWDADARPPEPSLEALTAVMSDLLATSADHGSVVLTGDGGDPMLLPSTLLDQIGRVPVARLAGDLWRLRAVPPLGIRSSVKRWFGGAPPIPAWLAQDLLDAIDPVARQRAVQASRRSIGGARQTAVNEVIDPWWTSMFEGLDPGATRRSVELRYPFFDVRLASFVLRLPSFPWCVNKRILRDSMRGRLPEPVRMRPKAPLAGIPVGAADRWSMRQATALFEQTPEIARFVDVATFRATVDHSSLLTGQSPGAGAAISLAVWLRHESGLTMSLTA